MTTKPASVPAPFASRSPTLLVAHRGGAHEVPENTLYAFEHAMIACGADMLELDVHPTRDASLAVVHDDTLERTTDAEGPMARFTMRELGGLDAAFRFSQDGGETFPLRGKGVSIPSLDEVLTRFPRALIHIELKPSPTGADDGRESLLVDTLKRHGATSRVCIGSADDALAYRLVAALPNACHFYPRVALALAVRALKAGELLDPADPFRSLSMPFAWDGVRLVDADLVARADAQSRWINAWTVDEETDMRDLRAARIGGIMTDRPTLLRRILGERQTR